MVSPKTIRALLKLLRKEGVVSAQIDGVGSFVLGHLPTAQTAQPDTPKKPSPSVEELLALRGETLNDDAKAQARRDWDAHWRRVTMASGSPIPPYPEHLA